MKDKIIIIGGGISGITTALTLQLLGYNTSCYAEHIVKNNAEENPHFASLYPAASIIPHSVQTDMLDSLFPPSLHIFEYLLNNNIPGMQRHKHYELFEFYKKTPSYAHIFKNYTRIENFAIETIPRRPGINKLHGWSFDCIITEWPVYIQQLYDWYTKAGGTMVRQKLYPEDLKTLNTDYIINCSGIWSHELFYDTESRLVVRGHILYIDGAPLIRDFSNNIISYNYTPDITIYTDPQGNPSDVYFYPRHDGWVLGGSRQIGTISSDESFEGIEHTNTININGLAVPKPIFELNRTILKESFDCNLPSVSDLTARVGYRYIRNIQNGLRLDISEEWGKTIIHNYGHGGAGVTLSWGCALHVFELIQKIKPVISTREKITPSLRRLKRKLLDIVSD